MNSNLTMVFIVLLLPWLQRQRLRELKNSPWDIFVYFSFCGLFICLLIAQWQQWIDLRPMEWIGTATKSLNKLFSPSS